MDMNRVFHRAEDRGKADFGWLQARQSFSFGRWFDPEKVHFGALRVLNDDYIAGGRGFDTHAHDNMEIITIILDGALKHRDSMGHEAVIVPGDIQVMSAGRGITHSEFNHLDDTPCKLLQLWIFPKKKGVEPRYGDMKVDIDMMKNSLTQIVSPDPVDKGSWIHQDAWLHLGRLDKESAHNYEIKKSTNGVYVFVIEGEIKIEGQVIKNRDAMGVWDTSSFDIEVVEDAYILLVDVPMEMSYV